MIDISVLMGVYNAPIPLLDQAIDSILGQTHAGFELLIIDDGNDDEALLAHLEQRARGDHRIRIAHEPHRGLTASLNRGIELARGTWIARHDADDWSDPQRLALQRAYLESHPKIALCGSNAWTHQQDGRTLWRTALPLDQAALIEAFPRGNPFVHGSTMYSREAARALGGYREAFRCSQDYDFFWRMTERFGAANLPAALYHYRYTSGSISSRKALDQRRAHTAARSLADLRRQGLPEDPAAELARVAAKIESPSSVFRALLKQADHIMLAGDYRAAASAYRSLLSEHPGSPLAWAKLARLGIFRCAPALREACFR